MLACSKFLTRIIAFHYRTNLSDIFDIENMRSSRYSAYSIKPFSNLHTSDKKFEWDQVNQLWKKGCDDFSCHAGQMIT